MAAPFKIETCIKIKFGLIFQLEHLVSHLGVQALPKITKMATLGPPFKIETCKNSPGR